MTLKLVSLVWTPHKSFSCNFTASGRTPNILPGVWMWTLGFDFHLSSCFLLHLGSSRILSNVLSDCLWCVFIYLWPPSQCRLLTACTCITAQFIFSISKAKRSHFPSILHSWARFVFLNDTFTMFLLWLPTLQDFPIFYCISCKLLGWTPIPSLHQPYSQ